MKPNNYRYHVLILKIACSDSAAWAAAANLMMEGNYNFNNGRRVDFYVLEAPTDRSSHLGESFPFYSDSGAERSLIKECSSCVLMIFTSKIISHVLADSYLKYVIAVSCGTPSLGFDVTLHKIASLCVKRK